MRSWIAALLLGCAACATTPAPIQMPASAAYAWTAQSPRAGEGALVLMGSMHVGSAPIELGPELAEAFTRSDVLVLELDTDAIGVLEAVGLVNRHAKLPPGETIADHISKENHAKLVAWSDRKGLSMATLSPFEPWLASTVVSSKEWELRGYLPEYGSEQQFMAFAHEQGKHIEELETGEEQMSLFSALSAESQEQLLEAALQEEDADFEEMARIWRSGDDQALALLLTREFEASGGEFFQRMIVDRNARMVERLLARVGDGRPRFVLVGVAHLVGERGIPVLLEERGYEVSRIRDEDPLGVPAPY